MLRPPEGMFSPSWFDLSRATKRNWLESAVNFFAKIRTQIPTMAYAVNADGKRLFEVLAKHGVVRRIGTTFNVNPGEPVPVFETTRRK